MLNNIIKLAGQKQSKLYNLKHANTIITIAEIIIFIAFMFISINYGLSHLTTIQ